MPYPTVVTTDAASADRVNQFRTYASQLPDPAQPQIDADVAAYNAHVAKLGDVTQPTTPSASSPAPSAAVASSAAAPSYGPIDSSSHQAFVQSMTPYAQLWEQKTGIPASTWIAMGASESNWGKAGGNELFGIKGGGNAGSLNSPTWESVNGKRVNINDNFAAYQTPNDAFQGFWNLVQGQRYAPALAVLRNGGSGYDFVRAINNAGYATDPNWAESIRSIAQNQIEPLIGTSAPRGAQAPYPQGLGDQNVGQPAAAPATSGVVSPQVPGGTVGGLDPRGHGNQAGNAPTLSGSSPQPPSPNDDLKEFSAYASSLGNPGGTSSFGSNPEDASSPIDQARAQGQTGLPDFAGMASSALGTVGGLVSSMLPKPQDQGFNLPSSSDAGPQSYNDMAGASSSPLPAFGTNPEDATSPIEQNRVSNPPAEASPFTLDWPSVTVPTNKKKPAPLPQLLAGESPLTDLGNQIVLGQRNRMANQDYSLTRTLGTRADQPAREQVAPTVNPADIRAGFTPSQQQAQFERAANIAMGSTGIEKVGAPSVVGEGKPFYSALTQAIETKVQPRGTVEQAKAALVNAGVKPIELATTGLDDYLASKAAGAKVTRTELQDFVAKNAVDVREVVYGSTPVQSEELRRLESFAQRTNHPEDWQAYEQAVQDSGGNVLRPPKYSGYTTPGADPGSYRELLLTTPKADPAGAAYDFRKSLTDKYGDGIMNKATPEEIQQLSALDRAAQAPAPASYQSSHYDEPNILAHVRFNTRTDASGAKVLHVEEIQSDWAQAGRKSPGSVPPTPFANTSDWAALAFKRVLRYAVDNGYDKVTWTTGAQQNARYSLAKQVDALLYDPESQGLIGMNGKLIVFQKTATPSELPGVIGQEASAKLLASPQRYGWHNLAGLDLEAGGSGMKGFYDTILPSVADKIGKKFGARTGEVAIPSTNTRQWFAVGPNGEQMHIGSSSSLTRSDAQSTIDSLKPGWRLEEQSPRETVHSFTIPTAMKASVQKGQTLFVPPSVAGAVAGGYAGSTQGNTPEERARNALLGAAAGGVGGHLLGSGQLGRLAREDAGTVNLGGILDAGKSAAKAVNELIAPAKNTPPQVQQALKDFANRNLEGAVQAETIGLRAKKILGPLDNSDTAGFFESTSQLHPNQTPEQAAFAREVHDYMETTKVEGKAHGYIQGDVVNGPNAQVSSYFPHIYQENLTRATSQARKGGLNPNDFYSNSRTFPTLSDAQAAGFNPVDSFSGPLQHYVGRVASSEAKYQLVESLKNAGPPAAIPYTAGMKLPDGWVAGSSTVPQFAKYAFPEPVAKAINNIVSGSGVRQYGVGRLVLNTQAEAKQLLFTLSGFHNVTELRQAVNANGFKGVPIVAKTLQNGFIPGAWDAFRLKEADGLALAARSGVTGLAGDTKALDVGPSGLSPLAATGVRSAAGAVSGAASGYGIGAASGADDQTKLRLALLGAVGGAVAGPAMKPIADALWERQVPTLKYLTWKTQVGLGRSPEAAATFANNTYGGQNLAAIARSKTVQDVTRTVLLAPDWWESWSRQIGNLAAKGDLGKTTREYWARTAIINAFTLEGLNYAFNHHFTNENDPDHANQVEVTGLYKQLGVDRRDPKTGAPVREYMSVLPSPIESLLALTSGTTGGAAKFINGRLSTGSRIAVQQLSNKDYRGQTIVPPYTPPLEEAKLRGANILGQVSPIGVQQAETSSANAEPTSLAAFATATGLRTSRAGQSTYGGPQLSQKSYDILSQSGLSDWRPTPIGNSIGGIGLSRDERTQYQNLVDVAREKMLVTMTSRPAWQKMSIAQRRTVLDEVMRSVDEAAGAQVLKGVPRDEAKKRLQLAASAK